LVNERDARPIRGSVGHVEMLCLELAGLS
jgi:hypothetical protein